jgi:hypothetical protein
MREDIKLKKYRKIRKDVNDLYCNKFMNVKSACKKIGISPSVYYKACQELGKNSVNTETNKSLKLKEKNDQNGGSKTDKINHNNKKSPSKKSSNDTSSIKIDTCTPTIDGFDSKAVSSRRLKMNTLQ